jgi:hypothetical protein
MKKELGQKFIDWLISPDGQKTIANSKIDGQQLFPTLMIRMHDLRNVCSATRCARAGRAGGGWHAARADPLYFHTRRPWSRRIFDHQCKTTLQHNRGKADMAG